MKKIPAIFLALLMLVLGSAHSSQAATTSGLLIDEMGFVSVYEGGVSDSYTIALVTAPTASVTVNLTAPANQLIVLPATLTFTTTNWSMPQTVTVEAFDDLIYEQAHSAIITHNTVSTDTNYDKKTATVTALITDNDAYGNNGGRDIQAPTAPADIKGVGDGKTITLSWVDPVAPDLRYVEVLRNSGGATPVDGVPYSPVAKGEQKFVDTAVTASQIYIYQLRSLDWSGNVRLSNEFSVKVAAPIMPAPAPTPVPTPAPTPIPVPMPTPAPGFATPELAAQEALAKSDAQALGVSLSSDQANILGYFYLNGFVNGGIADYAVKLGAGERRAIIRDYFETVGRAEISWVDIERMALGIKPVGRNLAKEQAQAKTALALWVKIKGRAPNFKNVSEDLAWNTLMYRIRFTRDLSKEKVGITKFRATMNRTPSTPMDWAMVRALGYVL